MCRQKLIKVIKINTFNFFPVSFEDVVGAGAVVDNIEGTSRRGDDVGVRTITQGSNQGSIVICTIIYVHTT